MYKTELSEEWYILTPINIGGKLINNGVGISYNEYLNEIEKFKTLEDYEARCIELNIILDEEL